VRWPGPATRVFVILLASSAYFWHSRDWNGASRLMLTYAAVDRGTVAIDGLERQTGDLARNQGRFYSDKLPGFSAVAVLPYAATKAIGGWPDHPVGRPGFAHWPTDYWVTLATSGLATAVAGAILVRLAIGLGCGPRRAMLVGLTYGLATPAYIYATLPYGHQLSACALLGSYALLGSKNATRGPFLAGTLAAFAATVELQVGPVAAVLGFDIIGQVIAGRKPASAVAWFAIGAVGPTLFLLGYNLLAFGSPWEMGYFHHANPRFAQVHSADNPTGLVRPDWSLVGELLWGGRRGLIRFAPVVALAVPGLFVLAKTGRRRELIVASAAMASVFVVNLSYPEWTGGWSTGPRLLLPLMPFAMIPVAALLGSGRKWATWLAIVLAAVGWVEMTIYQGADARIPETIARPLLDGAWPLWRGDPVPGWATPERFARNPVSIFAPGAVSGWPDRWKWCQFVPLILGQAAAFAALAIGPRPVKPSG